jgi:hypothetical protein
LSDLKLFAEDGTTIPHEMEEERIEEELERTSETFDIFRTSKRT